MRMISILVLSLCAVATVAQESAAKEEPSKKASASARAKGPLDFRLKNIDGTDVDLGKYRGKVVLLVNVASQCGLTPQYKQLAALHEKYASRGLAILGIPANNFGGQEPGTDAEIKEFCATKFDVKFDMFSKVSVAGDDQCPLYKWLTSKDTNPDFSGDIKWNFTKFVIGRDGKLAGRFEPRTRPDDADVVKLIEKALDAKAP